MLNIDQVILRCTELDDVEQIYQRVKKLHRMILKRELLRGKGEKQRSNTVFVVNWPLQSFPNPFAQLCMHIAHCSYGFC